MTAVTAGRHPHGPGRRPKWAIALGGFGELLITAGLLLLLLVVYELWITGIFTHREQHKLEKQLQKAWSAPAAPAAPGTAAKPVTVPPFGSGVAILHAARLGANWKWVVVEGVGTNDLAKGPGHYPGTALPGGVGNFVVSGHRTTHGAPFFNTDKLKDGDAVVVETATEWYVYKVTGETSVDPSDVGVVLPVPNDPGAKPTQKLLTFTTCNPKYSASHRLIIHGVLAEQEPKSQGQPAALTTGTV
jgi:sortase A